MAAPSLPFFSTKPCLVSRVMPRFTLQYSKHTMKKRSTYHCQAVSNGDDMDLLRFQNDVKQDISYYKYMENIEIVRTKFSKVNGVEQIVLVDSINRLCIDHHFHQEISSTLSSFYKTHCESFSEDTSQDLFRVSLSFRLLRQAGYDISSDVFVKFTEMGGEFKPSLNKDIKGLLSLHEASYLNTGNTILRNANAFSSRQLKLAIRKLEPNLAKLLKDTLMHPYHVSIHQYKARQHLKFLQVTGTCGLLEDIAVAEFKFNQAIYQKELEKLTRWWKTLGLANELPFARDQILNWYILSIIAIPGPQYTKQRLVITKVLSLIITLDDTFDKHGASLEDLSLFAEVFKKWDHRLASLLPNYMKTCYLTINDFTNEVSEMCSKEYGWNPINYLRKSWTRISDASLTEVRWYTSKQYPSTDEYLKNAVATIGVHTLLLHLFLMLGNGATEKKMHLVEENASLIYCPSKITRLWDDLNIDPNETGTGCDLSYSKLYMKENSHLSTDDLMQHVRHLISSEWEQLNKNCLFFDRSLFHPQFIQTTMNFARTITINYSFSGEPVPIFKDCLNAFLYGKFD
ncbi:S-(+)-linalool synthase [Rhynchospora pubera]|nr:S-(+)-linalool synthase [Rhynchospora pubera]